MQNQEDKLTKIVHEIQSLITDLKHVNTYNSVISNFFKINSLYEKAVFLKNLNAYQLQLPAQEPAQNIPQDELLLNAKTDLEEEKSKLELVEMEIEEEIILEEPQDLEEKQIIFDEIESVESILDEIEENVELNEEKPKNNLENLKVVLSKLKNKMEVPLPESELQIKQRFDFTSDEKDFYIKELFQNSFADWSTTMEKILSITKIEDASAYLSEIYYQKRWDKKEVIAQKFWQKIEKSF